MLKVLVKAEGDKTVLGHFQKPNGLSLEAYLISGKYGPETLSSQKLVMNSGTRSQLIFPQFLFIFDYFSKF